MSNPYPNQRSGLTYYIPPSLPDDFEKFLENDLPNTVMDWKLYHNWYHPEDMTIIRGIIYPASVKSRYENTDNQSNFRAGNSSGIRCGDILIDENGIYYLLDWKVDRQPNNRASRATECNIMLTVYRHVDETVDDMGMLVEEAHDEIIVDSLPSNISRSEYRIEYSILNTSPGMSPNTIAIVYVQVNEYTKQIRVGDEFDWNGESSVIVDIDPVDMDIDGQHGVLKLQARKLPGNEMNF